MINGKLAEEKQENCKQFIITKKIAKQGSQSLIVIPCALKNQIKPGTLAKVTIDILEELEERK